MPLFTEETAKSNELPAAIQLADRLADNPAVQDLAEKTTATETLTHIVVGIARDPFDGDTYTLAELESRHFVAHIYAEATEGYVLGPMQTELRSEGAQGKRLEAMLRVNWGDIETE
jgi:hypothetical protein